MLIYNTIQTVWRPLSRGRFLTYSLAEVLGQLGISRVQLTLLGVVSKNDYTSNLTRLGIASNYEIIKSLEKSEAGMCNSFYSANAYLHTLYVLTRRVFFLFYIFVQFGRCREADSAVSESSRCCPQES